MSNADLYVEQRVANEKPSALVAYILWFFLGFFGAHRFYLGKIGSGLCMLALFGIGTITAPVLIGWIPLFIVGLWWVIDLLTIPRMIRGDMRDIREKAYEHLSRSTRR